MVAIIIGGVVAIIVMALIVLSTRGKISLGASRKPSDPEEAARQTAVRDAISRLTGERNAYRHRVSEAEKALKSAEKTHKKLVKGATKQLEQVSAVPLISHAGAIRVFEDRVHTPEGVHPLDENVTALVDTAGNMAVTRRHTVTRFALLGPLSLFTPKATKHDDRELYFLIEHPQWASMVKLNPDQGTGARQAAIATNVAARNCKANARRRDQLTSDARDQLAKINGDRTGIDLADKNLHGAQDSIGVVDKHKATLDILVSSCCDQDARIIQKARKLSGSLGTSPALRQPAAETQPAP
jgi:hypothetical protein